MLKNLDVWIKMYPILLPVTSLETKYRKLNFNEWRLYYWKNWFGVITDNPLILRDSFKDFSSLNEELIVPLSSELILVSTRKHKPNNIAPVFKLQIDLLLFHRASRYVACANKEYLDSLIFESRNLLKPGYEERMKDSIFNHFY
jgi:hypothetical protein